MIEKIKQLLQSHPMPNRRKMEFHQTRIERMAKFYEDKIPDAPEKQGLMFESFVTALKYASSIMVQHQKLTEKLTEITEEEE